MKGSEFDFAAGQKCLMEFCFNLKRLYPEGACGMHTVLLEHGTIVQGQDLPSRYRYRPAKYCFYNSSVLAAKSPRLVYCEGLAIASDLPFPIHHGWCVTPDNQVVDVTWKNSAKCVYFGIKLKADKVLEIGKMTKCYSVLDNLEYQFEESILWSK